MFKVRVVSEFNAAHNLRHYRGKCEALHGHNWKVEISVCRKNLDHLGMVVDFKHLKKKLNKILDSLDHKYLNKLPAFKKINPTSENIAKYIFVNLKLKGAQVTVWETNTSSASFWQE
ncbi:MAG: 6-carboxytetrahydropterin synthase QueD [Candidatus Omnitrophota bacterium]